MVKKIFCAVIAVLIALFLVTSISVIDVGNVGVQYSASGVKDEVLTQGWHLMSPFVSVKQFPISQQQIVFSNDPADYNEKEHPDWSIDAPANGGTVKINLTVNYNFISDRVVELYKRFNGMDGQAIVESRVQNSIVAYVKEVTPQFTVMDIYSDKKSEVNAAITEYLNEKLTEEYGINVISALVIDVQLDDTLMQKVRAKEQAKQDAEIAELEKQTAIAQAETDKVKAQTEADIKMIEAQAEADANKIISDSITPNLIAMEEVEAHKIHGWVTVQGADSVIVDSTTNTNNAAQITTNTEQSVE